MRNKFFIDKRVEADRRISKDQTPETGDLTPKQITMLKENNQFALKILNQLYYAANKGDMDLLGNNYKAYALAGHLINSDGIVGVKSYNLAKKIRFLTMALCDKNHPENVEKFKNSFLYKGVLATIYSGYVTNANEKWNNFSRNSGCKDPAILKTSNALEAALVCHRENPTTAVGLDYAKLIDTIVGLDDEGKYCIKDNTTIEDEVEMMDAVQDYMKMLKSDKRFKDNFNNPRLEAEDELEAE